MKDLAARPDVVLEALGHGLPPGLDEPTKQRRAIIADFWPHRSSSIQSLGEFPRLGQCVSTTSGMLRCYITQTKDAYRARRRPALRRSSV
jgi:hypothetical protein